MKNKPTTSKLSEENLLELIIKNLDSNKGLDIVKIDMEGKSDICNYMIITSGTSNRHSSSLADKLIIALKALKNNKPDINVEGREDGKWVLIDLGSIVVHIFTNEQREFYNLESLWKIKKS